jgi:hypothetical protein
MWQKCPVCNGSGFGSDYYGSTCSTCQGARIISEITGLPPEAQIPKTVTTTGDIIVNIPEYRGTLTDEEKQFWVDGRVAALNKKDETTNQ